MKALQRSKIYGGGGDGDSGGGGGCCLAYSSNTVYNVPKGSPSRGGDIAVYVFDVNQPSLPTPFNLFLCLVLSLWPFQLFRSMNSPENSPPSRSILPVLFLP